LCKTQANTSCSRSLYLNKKTSVVCLVGLAPLVKCTRVKISTVLNCTAVFEHCASHKTINLTYSNIMCTESGLKCWLLSNFIAIDFVKIIFSSCLTFEKFKNKLKLYFFLIIINLYNFLFEKFCDRLISDNFIYLNTVTGESSHCAVKIILVSFSLKFRINSENDETIVNLPSRPRVFFLSL